MNSQKAPKIKKPKPLSDIEKEENFSIWIGKTEPFNGVRKSWMRMNLEADGDRAKMPLPLNTFFLENYETFEKQKQKLKLLLLWDLRYWKMNSRKSA